MIIRFSAHEHELLSKLAHWMNGAEALHRVMTKQERDDATALINKLAAESAPLEAVS